MVSTAGSQLFIISDFLLSLVVKDQSQLVLLTVEDCLGLLDGEEAALLAVDGGDDVSLPHLLSGH